MVGIEKSTVSERSISRDPVTIIMTNNWWHGMPKEIESDLESLSELNTE